MLRVAMSSLIPSPVTLARSSHAGHCPLCRAEVDLGGANCTVCGIPFHTPDAAHDVHMLEPAKPLRTRHDRCIATSIFSFIMLLGFWPLHIALKSNLIPGLQDGRLEIPVMCVYCAAMVLFLLAGKYFDKH